MPCPIVQAPMWRRAVLIGLTTLAGCGGVPSEGGSPPPQSSTSTTAPTSTTSPPPPTGGLEVIVPPASDGSLPPEVLVACPTGPVFPFGSLEEIRPIDQSMAEAISGFLGSGEGDFWPQTGWMILHETESMGILVNRSEHGFSFMFVERREGTWEWTGAAGGGPCPLQYTVPSGLNTVGWRLDPASPPPRPDSTHVDVLLNERECVSGQPIGDRLVGPQVVLTEDALHMAFAAQPPPGEAFDCQGNPDMPYTVDLPEPLGEREVVEGLDIGVTLDDFVP